MLINRINFSLSNGYLTNSQKIGIINLIPKKDKNKVYLNNWRPISLLNTDYKIITRAIANRIYKSLRQLISYDQTGYIKGKFIGFNIRKIEDCIQ